MDLLLNFNFENFWEVDWFISLLMKTIEIYSSL